MCRGMDASLGNRTTLGVVHVISEKYDIELIIWYVAQKSNTEAFEGFRCFMVDKLMCWLMNIHDKLLTPCWMKWLISPLDLLSGLL